VLVDAQARRLAVGGQADTIEACVPHAFLYRPSGGSCGPNRRRARWARKAASQPARSGGRVRSLANPGCNLQLIDCWVVLSRALLFHSPTRSPLRERSVRLLRTIPSKVCCSGIRLVARVARHKQLVACHRRFVAPQEGTRRVLDGKIWIRVKNPATPAVKRKAEEEWGRRR
jgi:hypothetical protein